MNYLVNGQLNIPKETLERMDAIAKTEHKKNFSDLPLEEQEKIEREYHKWYPEDLTPRDSNPIRHMYADSNTELHHDKENILFHLRMDDRVGVGNQSGEKILNVFEIQSDWYQRANREGVYDLEKYDTALGELNHNKLMLKK